MSELLLILILSLIVIAVIELVLFLLRKRLKTDKPQSEAIIMLQQQLNHISQVLDSKLSESTRAIQLQFGQSAKIIQDVTEKLTRLDETNKQVVSFADQLRNLQDILKNPKQRGVLGEYYLETVLKNVLPPGSYQMQYSLGMDERTNKELIVDAVVFVGKNIIPIDSKFSLENYNRMIEASDQNEKKKYENILVADLKNRIEETAKYVKPEKKTMDFAFMFIPSEAVYYDLLINKIGEITEETNNLIYYAGKKKVIIVSPTSFLAYLQTVLQGLRNQKISEEAKEVIKEIEKLSRHLWTYSEYMKKLGIHLQTTVSAYNKAGSEFKKVDKDVVKITGEREKIKIEEVEPPLLEE